MSWKLNFISEEEFKNHVRATIMKYGEKLESYDLKRFNSNLIDPIKLLFDKSVYQASWEEIVNNEIFRQSIYRIQRWDRRPIRKRKSWPPHPNMKCSL